MHDHEAGDQLHLLAVDHRNSLLTGMAEVARRPRADQAEVLRTIKALVLDGLLRALQEGAPRAPAGLLIDADHGTEVTRRARAEGLTVAVPVERSGQRELVVEDLDRVLRLEPNYVKVLVRYNTGGDPALNARQRESLQGLGTAVARAGQRLMLELLVPAEPEQLGAVGGDAGRYDREVRPGLVRAAIDELQEAGVEPDTWKIEGLDSTDDCAMVAAAARRGDRAAVHCIVLGRGADADRVDRWLQVAAPVAGFGGFAVGRTIWWRPVEEHLSGVAGREAAVEQVAAAYRHVVDVHCAARLQAGAPA